MAECPQCMGRGYIIRKDGYPRFERFTCPTCEGRGTLSSIKVDYSYISKPVIKIDVRRKVHV